MDVPALRDRPIEALEAIVRTYGPVAYVKAGVFDVYVVTDPDAVREILVTQASSFMKSQVVQHAKRTLGEGLLTSEGELHKRQRRLIQPVFHHARIGEYARLMTEIAEDTRDGWTDGEVVEVNGEMLRLTLRVVTKALLGVDIQSSARDIGEALSVVLEMYDLSSTPMPAVLDRMSPERTERFRAAQAMLDEAISSMIEERRRVGGAGGDLLSRLLEAEDPDGGGGRMSDRQIRDEVMTLVLAGHETTANTLTWAWYLLSEHPDIEARLHAEWDAVLGGRSPSVEDVPQLDYTVRVITESLRLFPPIWVTGRVAVREAVIAGYHVPPGSVVLLAQHVAHHDPDRFPDPERFEPDRWLPENRASLARLAFFPFGAGPRACVGEPFAWMEATLVLPTIGQRWRPRLEPGHPVELLPRISLRPKGGMPMRVEDRLA